MTYHLTTIIENRSSHKYFPCFSINSVSTGLPGLVTTNLTEAFMHRETQVLIIDEIWEKINYLFGVSRQLHISHLTIWKESYNIDFHQYNCDKNLGKTRKCDSTKEIKINFTWNQHKIPFQADSCSLQFLGIENAEKLMVK